MQTKIDNSDINRQISSIQKEIRETPYHKGTEHHIGRLRARIARLRDKRIGESAKKGGGGGGYAVKHQGDATVVLVGPPSVGKSTLLNKLTNAQSKVAPYAFTTVSVIPGMLIYQNARIQILDVPGLIEGAEEGKGRGREVLSVARGCDLLIILTEVGKMEALKRITQALERNGIRLNQQPPRVTIEKKLGGGIIIHSNLHQEFTSQTVKEVAGEFGIRNADITIKEKLSLNRLIDAFSANRVYIPVIYAVNKIDQLSNPDNNQEINGQQIQFISAAKNISLEEFKNEIWKALNFITVYLVKADENPGFVNPIIMRRGQQLTDVLTKLGPDFAENKKSALIWGSEAKYPAQEVSLTAPLFDNMQVRFV